MLNVKTRHLVVCFFLQSNLQKSFNRLEQRVTRCFRYRFFLTIKYLPKKSLQLNVRNFLLKDNVLGPYMSSILYIQELPLRGLLPISNVFFVVLSCFANFSYRGEAGYPFLMCVLFCFASCSYTHYSYDTKLVLFQCTERNLISVCLGKDDYSLIMMYT